MIFSPNHSHTELQWIATLLRDNPDAEQCATLADRLDVLAGRVLALRITVDALAAQAAEDADNAERGANVHRLPPRPGIRPRAVSETGPRGAA